MTWILDWKARLQSKFDSWAKMLGFLKGVHGGEQMEKPGEQFQKWVIGYLFGTVELLIVTVAILPQVAV